MNQYTNEELDIIHKSYNSLSNEQLVAYWKAYPENTYPVAKTFLHTHTDMGSPKDSILTIPKYISTAKQFGASSIAISDHGSMYAVQGLYNECQDNGIKLIIGIEFYVCDTVEDQSIKNHTRLHLTMYAKDKIGYTAISKLVSASNKRLLVTRVAEYPCISENLLRQYVGKGSSGYGHVFATSACIGGVVTGLSFKNEDDKKNAFLLQEKANKGRDCVIRYKSISNNIDELTKQKDVLTLIAGKKYGKRKKEGTEEEMAALFSEMKETEHAIVQKDQLTKRINEAKKSLTAVKKTMNTLVSFFSTIENFEVEVEKKEKAAADMVASLCSEAEMVQRFEKAICNYDDIIGHGNWFVEIQYHGIPEEKKYMSTIAEIANRYGIPLVAANDAHMQLKSECKYRKLVNGLRINSPGKMWQPEQPGDEELYLKDDITLYKWINKVVSEKDAINAMFNRQIIADGCNVELKKEPHYPKYIISEDEKAVANM